MVVGHLKQIGKAKKLEKWEPLELIEKKKNHRFEVVFSYSMGFLCGSAGKESACNAGDLGSIGGLGRPPGELKGYPPQYSGLENSMDCISMGWQRVHFHFHNILFGAFQVVLVVKKSACQCRRRVHRDTRQQWTRRHRRV